MLVSDTSAHSVAAGVRACGRPERVVAGRFGHLDEVLHLEGGRWAAEKDFADAAVGPRRDGHDVVAVLGEDVIRGRFRPDQERRGSTVQFVRSGTGYPIRSVAWLPSMITWLDSDGIRSVRAVRDD